MYAHFEAIIYYITYNGNGNTGGATSSTTCSYDQECILANNGFIRTNYTFSKWAQGNVNGTQRSQGTAVKNLTTTNGGTVTMYAIWGVRQYTLNVTSQNTNFGTVSAPNGQISFGTSVTITATPKTNYKFLGWSDGSNIISTDLSYTFTMPARNYALSGIFTIAETNNGEVIPYDQNTTFIVVKDCKNWWDAEAYAQTLGGHLAKIDTAEKYEYLYGLIESVSDVWIGLTDKDEEGTWRWVIDGTIAGYTTCEDEYDEEDNYDSCPTYSEGYSGWIYHHWRDTQPDSNSGDEDYVKMTINDDWHDYNGTDELPFIVEIRT